MSFEIKVIACEKKSLLRLLLCCVPSQSCAGALAARHPVLPAIWHTPKDMDVRVDLDDGSPQSRKRQTHLERFPPMVELHAVGGLSPLLQRQDGEVGDGQDPLAAVTPSRNDSAVDLWGVSKENRMEHVRNCEDATSVAQ